MGYEMADGTLVDGVAYAMTNASVLPTASVRSGEIVTRVTIRSPPRTAATEAPA